MIDMFWRLFSILENVYFFPKRRLWKLFFTLGKKTYRSLYPLTIMIGVTDKCNLKCVMCPRTLGKVDLGSEDLTLEKFKYIIAQLPCLQNVAITGFGEPLFCKDLFDMIKYSKSKNRRTRLVSNGTLLDAENQIKLLESGLDEVSFSIDSPSPEGYARIRGRNLLDQVVKNITNLAKLRDERNSPMKIMVNYVAMKSNYAEIPEMVELCIKMGVDRLTISDVAYQLDMRIDEELKQQSLRSFKDGQTVDLRKKIKEAKEEAKTHGLAIALKGIGYETSAASRCYVPFYAPLIRLNGDVEPCCHVHNLSMGNIYKEKFSEIFNNKNMRNFRKTVLQKPPDFCRHCYDLYSHTTHN